MLHMEVCQVSADVFIKPQGDDLAVNPANILSGTGDFPGKKENTVPGGFNTLFFQQRVQGRQAVNIKSGLHHGFFCSGTNLFRGSASPQGQLQGLNNDRFTCAGFPGEDVKALMKVHIQQLNNPEISDKKTQEHFLTPCSGLSPRIFSTLRLFPA